jgi:LacI family transcriptional regulator
MPKPQRRIAIGIDLDAIYKHHTDVAGGILRYAQAHGWECLFEPFIGAGVQGRRAPRYDGVIARITHAAAGYVKRARIPTVNVWVGSPDRTLPRVVPDQFAAGKMAAAHLLERGFCRFGFLGFRQDHNSELQLQGFQAAIATRQCRCAAHVVARLTKNAREWHRLQSSLTRWAQTWKTPIGVFATQDVVCRYLANVCLQLGLQIPEDVALIGCGNDELICESLSPKVTSIEHRPGEVGYRAAELLDRLMKGVPPPTSPVLIAPAALVARASTDVYAVDDPLVAKALRYISDSSARPIGVRDVVAGLPMTRRSLERRFRSVLGRSIHEEITRSRITRFKRLLVEKDAPIKTLAGDAGFSSGEHLSKVFRKHEGTSPGVYRQEHQRKAGP